MNTNDELSSVSLHALVQGHNGQEDQRWARTLNTKTTGNSREIIGVCNYGNLYFVQLLVHEDDILTKIDWIRKTDVSKKYQNIDMSEVPVRDNVLDKFREEFKKAKQ